MTLDGRRFVPRQGNNSYIFPGVGLGAIATRARHVTDEMFMAAVHALCAQVTPEDLAQGSLYPPLARVREVSAHIAAAVAQVAFDRGLAGMPRPPDLLAHRAGRRCTSRATSTTPRPDIEARGPAPHDPPGLDLRQDARPGCGHDTPARKVRAPGDHRNGEAVACTHRLT